MGFENCYKIIQFILYPMYSIDGVIDDVIDDDEENNNNEEIVRSEKIDRFDLASALLSENDTDC